MVQLREPGHQEDGEVEVLAMHLWKSAHLIKTYVKSLSLFLQRCSRDIGLEHSRSEDLLSMQCVVLITKCALPQCSKQ